MKLVGVKDIREGQIYERNCCISALSKELKKLENAAK